MAAMIEIGKEYECRYVGHCFDRSFVVSNPDGREVARARLWHPEVDEPPKRESDE